MYKIHAWILAPTEKDECHKFYSRKTKTGLILTLLYCRFFYDYIEIDCDEDGMEELMNGKERIR